MSKKFNPRVTPWEVRESDFASITSFDNKAKFLLRYAILAPSGHNTQPWKFGLQSDGVSIHADYTSRLPVVDPDDRELMIGVGAALMNIRVAAAYFGYACEAQYPPEEDEDGLLATINLYESDEVDQELIELFPAIVRRRTNRNSYEERPLTGADIEKLKALSTGDKASFRIITDEVLKTGIAEMVSEGGRLQMSDASFRKELAAWVRPSWTRLGDGVAADGFGIPGIISWMAPWLMRTFDLGKSQAKKDQALVSKAAGLVIFHSEETRESLLKTGELLEFFLLTTTSMGLQYSFFNQPIEINEIRSKLVDLLDIHERPQLLLRIGYGKRIERAMPRRWLDSALLQ